MVESTPLALLPLIAAILVMSARFYIRESAISIFKLSFICAALSSLLLVVYMSQRETGQPTCQRIIAH